MKVKLVGITKPINQDYGETTEDIYNLGVGSYSVLVTDSNDCTETLEFEITPDLVVTSPQPVRFFNTQQYDVLTDLSIDIDLNSPLIVTGTPGSNFTTRAVNTYTNNSITEENVFANDYIKAGLPLTSETDFRVLINIG